MKILLIEDHAALREMVAGHLTSRGFAVDEAASADEARAALSVTSYDVLVLDLGLPDVDGIELLEETRRKTSAAVPVIVVTARDALDERVRGLNAGADDYIVKPFDLVELEARLRAVLRRPGGREDMILRCGRLHLNTVSREASVGSALLDLTRREAALLEELLRARGRIVVKDALEDRIYALGEDVTSNALEAVVSRLRRKLAAANAGVQLDSRRGIGYRLVAGAEFMRGGYSLRRRLLFWMIATFALGLAASVAFEYLELIDIKAPGALEEVIEVLLLALPFLVVTLLSWLIVGWSIAPLSRASREAELVGPADPAVRISDNDLPLEIQPLVRAVNGALDRLAGAYEAERRLTANAAHELRTPLAVLSLRLQRAKLERQLDWPAIERDLAQMSRLVGQIVDLARKEAPERSRRSEEQGPVNLSRVAREVAAMMLPLVEQAGRSIEVDAPEPVTVRGRAGDLSDMLRNLVDNALVHGRGLIRVRVAAGGAGEGSPAILEVSDEGPGLPEGLKASLFARFGKGVATSPGAGLGLAIVRQVAQAHGGEARFQPGDPCVVRISLPSAA